MCPAAPEPAAPVWLAIWACGACRVNTNFGGSHCLPSDSMFVFNRLLAGLFFDSAPTRVTDSSVSLLGRVRLAREGETPCEWFFLRVVVYFCAVYMTHSFVVHT